MEHGPISNDPFAPLQQRFLVRCGDQLVELKTLARKGNALPGGSRSPLVGVAHSLAGAAGTFGFPVISMRASELEALLIEQANEGTVQVALDALIAEIQRTLK